MGENYVTEAMTPLDVFKQERAAELAAMAKKAGSEGAFARLMQKMDTGLITDWLGDERKRGTKDDDVLDAFTNALVNAVAPVALKYNFKNPTAIGHEILDLAKYFFAAMMKAKLEVVAVNEKDGRQVQTTLEGVKASGLKGK